MIDASTCSSAPMEATDFEEFRRDVEDRGVWTPIQFYSGAVYPSREAALAAAVAIGGLVARSHPAKSRRTEITAAKCELNHYATLS